MHLSIRSALVRTGVVAALAATALTAVSVPALADDSPRAAPPAQPAPPLQPAPPAQPAPMTAQQLEELVAPIALYPDVVLYSMLPAATAPADVAAAAKFVATAGGKVDAAPEGVTWDPNVVGMLQYPEVLQWMNENPAWLEQMGFAMATQQADVLAAVQRYRAKAKAAGVLEDNDKLKVVVQNPVPSQPDQQVIVIQPAQPQVVYVPVYDPWPILQPSYVYQSYNPYFSGWYGYSFDTGPWAWNEIAWGYPGYYGAFYVHNDPWWWSGRSRYGYGYGWGGRPYLWHPQYRSDWAWSRHGWQPPYTVRPTNPTLRTSPGVGTSPGAGNASVVMRPRGTIRPTARVSTRPTLTPSPVLRPSPNTTFRRRDAAGGATVETRPTQPGTRFQQPTVQPTQPTEPRVRTVPTQPGVRFQPTQPTQPTPRWRTEPGATPTPRALPNPNVIDRSRVDVWGGRGRASLGSDVRATPAPRAMPAPRAAPAAQPTYRVRPTAPRANPQSALPSRRVTGDWRARGEDSLNRR